MFNPSRDQARQFFIESWRKQSQRLPMTQMEIIAADLVKIHPEYHELLGCATKEPDNVLKREWTPEQGEGNPFLHLSLHLAIEEQLSIDQPPGIRAIFNALLARHGERHAALHEVLECLGETVWKSQRDNAPPDGAAYLDCLRRRS
jgi:hypothetical protein